MGIVDMVNKHTDAHYPPEPIKIGIIVNTDGTIQEVRSDNPDVQVTVCSFKSYERQNAAFKAAWTRDYYDIESLPHEVWS